LAGRGPVYASDGRGSWSSLCSEKGEWSVAYFSNFDPVAMAGYSIRIYHITIEDANRVRRELGLPELPEDYEVDLSSSLHAADK
jgi:hypothetical protein